MKQPVRDPMQSYVSMEHEETIPYCVTDASEPIVKEVHITESEENLPGHHTEQRQRNNIPDEVITDLYDVLSQRAKALVPDNSAMVSGEDMVMSTMEKLMYSGAAEKAYEDRDNGSFNGYALIALQNTFFAAKNKEKTRRTAPYDDLSQVTPCVEVDPAQLYLDNLLTLVANTLDNPGTDTTSIGHEQLEAVLLRHVIGYKYDEIAAIQGIKGSTVKVRVQRALVKLRNDQGIRDYAGKGHIGYRPV